MGKLNAVKIKSLVEPGMHGNSDGLWLQVQTEDQRSWLFRYTSPTTRKVRGMGLGGYPSVSVAAARDEAAKARALVRAGFDPIDARKHNIKPAGYTVREAGTAYVQAHTASWRNNKHAAQWTATMAAYVYPAIGDRIAREVTTRDVLNLLTPIWQTKNTTASRVRERIECILDFARVSEGGWDEKRNPAIWRGNLALLLPKPKSVHTVKHYPSLPYVEMAAFWPRLRQAAGIAACAVELLILTAVRTKPVRLATWAEIDWDNGLWDIPAAHMKNGLPFTVPLSAEAIRVLQAMLLVREGDDPADLIFPGRGKPMSENTLAAVLKRLRVSSSHATVHGFRSTFKSWATAKTPHEEFLVEECLSHAAPGGATRKAYQRDELLSKRRAVLTDWSDLVCARGQWAGYDFNADRRAALA